MIILKFVLTMVNFYHKFKIFVLDRFDDWLFVLAGLPLVVCGIGYILGEYEFIKSDLKRFYILIYRCNFYILKTFSRSILPFESLFSISTISKGSAIYRRTLSRSNRKNFSLNSSSIWTPTR